MSSGFHNLLPKKCPCSAELRIDQNSALTNGLVHKQQRSKYFVGLKLFDTAPEIWTFTSSTVRFQHCFCYMWVRILGGGGGGANH